METGVLTEEDIVYQAFAVKVGIFGGAFTTRDIPWCYPHSSSNTNTQKFQGISFRQWASFTHSLFNLQDPTASVLFRGLPPDKVLKLSKNAEKSGIQTHLTNFVTVLIDATKITQQKPSALRQSALPDAIRRSTWAEADIRKRNASACVQGNSLVFRELGSSVTIKQLSMDGCMVNDSTLPKFHDGVWKLTGFRGGEFLTVAECEAWTKLAGETKSCKNM